MKTPPTALILIGMLMCVGATLSGCSTERTAQTPRIDDKTFTLQPKLIPVRVGILAGELSDLSVIQRVNARTGDVVYAPQLQGSLKLKNTSSDEAVRLVDGELEYLDASGAPIALADDRADASFSFYHYSSERLDPGTAMTQRVDVPFPAAALTDKRLSAIRLSVTYLPAPYREESVKIPVALGGP